MSFPGKELFFQKYNHTSLSHLFKDYTDKQFHELSISELNEIILKGDNGKTVQPKVESDFREYVAELHKKSKSNSRKRRSKGDCDSDDEYHPENDLESSEESEDSDLEGRNINQISNLQKSFQQSLSIDESSSDTAPRNTPNPSTENPRRSALIDSIARAGQKRLEYSELLKVTDRLNLEEFLSNCDVDGVIILTTYKVHGILEDEDRYCMCKLIIKWLLARCPYPGAEILQKLADKISVLFPSEDKIYYIRAHKDGRRKVRACGMLVSSLRTIRARMIRKGILSGNEKRQRESDSSDEEDTSTISTDETTALAWLRIWREPENSVKENWQITSKIRLQQLIEGKKITLESYLKQYPVLKLTIGQSLVKIDFASLHPNKQENLAKNWENFITKVLSLINKSRIRNGKLSNYKKLLKGAISNDGVNAIVLLSLPIILPATHQAKIGGKFKKISSDIAEAAFIRHVTTSSQAVELRDKVIAEAVKDKITVQPYIIYVGPDITTVQEAYVCVNDFWYSFDNLLSALDVCFKIFYVFDIHYSRRAQHIWSLLQEFVYEIDLGQSNNESLLNVRRFISTLKIETTSASKKKSNK